MMYDASRPSARVWEACFSYSLTLEGASPWFHRLTSRLASRSW
jgi:hypothetical protein